MSTQRDSHQFRQICFVTNLVKTPDLGAELHSEWPGGINSQGSKALIPKSHQWLSRDRTQKVKCHWPTSIFLHKGYRSPWLQKLELERNPKTSVLIYYFCSSNFTSKKKKKRHNWRCWRETVHFISPPGIFTPRDTCITDSFAHYKSTSTVLCSSFCSNIQVTKVRKHNTRKSLRVLYITVAQLCFDTFCWFNI